MNWWRHRSCPIPTERFLKTSNDTVCNTKCNTASNNQTGKPLRHYLSIYQDLDPKEIAQRCNVEFNSATSSFDLRVLGTEYRVPHPDFTLLDTAGKESVNPYEKILFLRYLCEGKFFPSQGEQLSYNEFPWGGVYYRNFEGRCLKRCANTFGRDIPGFVKMLEKNPQLRAVPISSGPAFAEGTASCRLEFINGLYVTMILWQADEEFPPSAQILFDDNFVFAFTAEDLAVAGEILLDHLKRLM
jgi:hypothetical protein